jgi:hypothetical protein
MAEKEIMDGVLINEVVQVVQMVQIALLHFCTSAV